MQILGKEDDGTFEDGGKLLEHAGLEQEDTIPKTRDALGNTYSRIEVTDAPT